MIKPIQDRVLLKVIDNKEEEKTQSGIILPNAEKESRVEKLEVISVGPGAYAENGTLIEMVVKEGQTVIIDKFSGMEFTEDDIKYKIVRQADILAIIE